ncbi:MAG: hypothetical protein V2J65_32345 [Desulfobacteraceae bacterium]|jgi:hypothetical protein|nr:hypothetical protein [Desulfobacteraceae bacterium]
MQIKNDNIQSKDKNQSTGDNTNTSILKNNKEVSPKAINNIDNPDKLTIKKNNHSLLDETINSDKISLNMSTEDIVKTSRGFMELSKDLLEISRTNIDFLKEKINFIHEYDADFLKFNELDNEKEIAEYDADTRRDIEEYNADAKRDIEEYNADARIKLVEKYGIIFSGIMTKIGCVILIIWLVRILIKKRLHSIFLSSFYNGISDSLYIYSINNKVELDKLIPILIPARSEFMVDEYPLDKISDLIKLVQKK